MFVHHSFQFIDSQDLFRSVKHRVTVGAYRPQILDGIHSIAAIRQCYLIQVMDVNEPFAKFTVHLPKIESANKALGAISLDTGFPSDWIALMSIHADRFFCALDVFMAGFQFVGKKPLSRVTNSFDLSAVLSQPFCRNCEFTFGEQWLKLRL